MVNTTPAANNAGNAGIALLVIMLKAKAAINRISTRYLIQGLAKACGTFCFFMPSLILIAVTAFMTVLIGQSQPQYILPRKNEATISHSTIREQIIAFLTYEYHIQQSPVIKLNYSKKRNGRAIRCAEDFAQP